MLKKITINNDQNKKIIGILHTGKLTTLFITIHGFKSSKENFAIKELSNQLNQAGYPVYRLDLVGDYKSDSALDIIQQVNKVNLTVSFLKKDYKKIILVGGSLGALVSMYVAKDNDDIGGLVTINGFFYFWGVRWKDFKTILLLFISSFFNKFSRNILIYYYKNLRPQKIKVPTLVICSTSDKRINYRQSLKFYNSLKTKKTLKVLNDIDHDLSKKLYVVEVFNEIKNWAFKNEF